MLTVSRRTAIALKQYNYQYYNILMKEGLISFVWDTSVK